MKGMRPMSAKEVLLVPTKLQPRDRALFILGCRSGFRISELLALRVRDIWSKGRVVRRVWLSKRHTKGCLEGRSLPVHQLARASLAVWLGELRRAGKAEPNCYLFRSRKGGNKAISRVQAWRVLAAAYDQAGLEGRLGTHAMRKTFAKVVYKATGNDLVATKLALGHRDIGTTVDYLAPDQELVDRAVLGRPR